MKKFGIFQQIVGVILIKKAFKKKKKSLSFLWDIEQIRFKSGFH